VLGWPESSVAEKIIKLGRQLRCAYLLFATFRFNRKASAIKIEKIITIYLKESSFDRI
jgi:hypothetical protein